jgi:hypothetical protein
MLRNMLFRVRVEGESGWPHLVPGKIYWASSLRAPRVGGWVVFNDPRLPERVLVKRIAAVHPEGYEVQSAVSWGTSSREFGTVPRAAVRGALLFV